MIRHDLHVHSVQSRCGMHAVLEIVEIAAYKGLCTFFLTERKTLSTD